MGQVVNRLGKIWAGYFLTGPACGNVSITRFFRKNFMKNLIAKGLRTLLALSLCVSLSIGLSSASSLLPSGNAITDAKAILRYALPINSPDLRKVQASLEDISYQIRSKRWQKISSDIKQANSVLATRTEAILQTVPEERRTAGAELLEQIKTGVAALGTAAEAKDKETVQGQRNGVLDKIGDLEASMVTEFPYEVPEEYRNLPQLKGRATIAMTTTKGDLEIVVDGYSAPVTAGNFVDLVQRGFYNKLPFTRAEDSYVLQVGDPPGDEVGFIDPKTKKYRAVPLEVLVKGDGKPTYGITLEDAGRYNDAPVLPFSSFGALAMARPEPEPNGGSSQFFFFLFEPELTPAGRNLLDGRYAVFGYVTAGQDVLDAITATDGVVSAKVVKGLENLVKPA
jgi:peptidylprolyl isomerase